MASKLSTMQLIEALAEMSEMERLEFCDALVDDPRLRDLLETIDEYMYLEAEEVPPVNLQRERDLLN